MAWHRSLSKEKYMAALPIWMGWAVSRFLVCSLPLRFPKSLLRSLQEILGKEHTSTFYYIGSAKWACSITMLRTNMSITYFQAINLPELLTRKYLSNGLLPRILYSRPSLLRTQK